MNITSEEYKEMFKKKPKSASKNRGKFNNIKTFYDGKKFDSKKECERYKELKQKKVADLKCQVKFPIQINSVKVCSYIADFTYLDHKGNMVVEDVKSEMTRKLPVYRLKKKLMKAVYGVEIKEV